LLRSVGRRAWLPNETFAFAVACCRFRRIDGVTVAVGANAQKLFLALFCRPSGVASAALPRIPQVLSILSPSVAVNGKEHPGVNAVCAMPRWDKVASASRGLKREDIDTLLLLHRSLCYYRCRTDAIQIFPEA
jgi:hypothetical protein